MELTETCVGNSPPKYVNVSVNNIHNVEKFVSGISELYMLIILTVGKVAMTFNTLELLIMSHCNFPV